jgi:hypothetical protein
MCDLIAKTIGEDINKINVITNEDSDFDEVHAMFLKSNFKPLRNSSAETSTYYSQDSNVVMSKDGSVTAYYVPSYVFESNKGVNEAKISYSLEDLMGDVADKDYKKMCELIARTIGEDPKDIAVITNEDDEFDKYQAKFKNDPTSAMNNPSSETSTYYNKKHNVVTGNDGSTITYFIPAKQLFENFVNEA